MMATGKILGLILVVFLLSLCVGSSAPNTPRDFAELEWNIAFVQNPPPSICENLRDCRAHNIGVIDLATGDVNTLEVGWLHERIVGSPASNLIAYQGQGFEGIQVISTDSEQHFQLIEAIYVRRMAWSPDGSKMAYLDVGNGETFSIIDVESGDVIRLSADKRNLSIQSPPIWSPDGTMIAYLRVQMLPHMKPSSYEVIVLNVEEQRVVYETDDDFEDGFPRWFEDSSKIAFWSERSPKPGSMVVDLSNGQTEFNENVFPEELVASSDSTLIYGHHTNYDLLLKNLETEKTTQVLQYGHWLSLSISPDGAYVAYLPKDEATTRENLKLCIYAVQDATTICYEDLNMHLWAIPTWVKKSS